MGYYSDVTVTLTGEKQEIKDLLNAYKLTETKDQIAGAWHLLEDNPDNEQVKFFYEFIDANDPVVQLTWLFNGVKWYDESEQALHRLGNMLEEMQKEDKNQSLAMTTARLGENADDYEENHWGENPYDYENPVDLVRQFDVQAPVVEVNPIKHLFNEGV
jgi:hypothetical protein